MLTKEDFKKAIASSITSYPSIEPLFNVKDPRILQNLDAMATMLAMFSAQIDVATTEAFSKSRDSTVLADAAMRGIIRKATSTKVIIAITNNNTSDYTIDINRNITDSDGRYYITETTTTVLANGGVGTFEATQVETETISHTVTESIPFYAIEVPDSIDDTYLTSIAVDDIDGQYEYRNNYVNIASNERVFHVEIDERQVIYIRFGQEGVVATQPPQGLVVNLRISRSHGKIELAAKTPFSLDYILSPNDSLIELELDSVRVEGGAPPSISFLRDLARFPSVYDHNAVFLGEFEFLIKSSHPDLLFSSVWNELTEETVRGVDVGNINTLFVAMLSSDNEETLIEPDINIPTPPTLLAHAMVVNNQIQLISGTLSSTQTSILHTIARADNSYKVKFYTPVRSEVEVTIKVTISTSYLASDIYSKIEDAILSRYGESSLSGNNTPLYRDIYTLLREKVTAISDGALADLTVDIASPLGTYRPELWRYVTTDSLTIEIKTQNILLPAWGR